MSLVGPLVTPNKIETHFDRNALRTRVFHHPILTVLFVVLALVGTAIATHTVPSPF